jgi:hypothetical protein
MEGLRLLDESQREGAAEGVEESAASGAGVAGTGSSNGIASPGSNNRTRTEEEEDVLLDS